MQIPRRLGAVAAATAATTFVLAAGSAGAHQLGGRSPHFVGNRSRDVFVQTDGQAGNTIDVYDRSFGGQLTLAGEYPTGGLGGQTAGSVADHLSSQNSLVYDAWQSELFAVNAGSNTISAFDVRGDRLHLRQVISSGGSFPVSLTVHGDLVYVLNAFDGGSIQGYRLLGGELAPIPGSNRALGLNPTATPQFVTTPGDIAFSPDGRDLLVTTKDNTNAIDVFSVSPAGQPGAAPVVNSEPGTVPFALAFEPGNQVAVGEAGTDTVAAFTLNGDGTLTERSSVATGQQATCWLVADGWTLFAGNAGSSAESVIADTPFAPLRLTQTEATDAGTIDATISPDGRYLYVQAGVAGTVDEYAVGFRGQITQIGSVTVPGGVGQEGIAAS